MGLAIYILINRALRSLDIGLLDSCLQFVLGRLHQWRVESATHLQRQSALGTSSLQLFASLVDGVNITRDNQLTSSVRWTQCVQNMIQDGADDFTECGPGKTLQGMISKINKEVSAHGIAE